MRTKSVITGKYYDPNDVVFIPNMLQNFWYMTYGAELLDVIPDSRKDQKRIVFVWDRAATQHLYDAWCNHNLV